MVAFVNSRAVDREKVWHETFSSPAAVRAWLGALRLPGADHRIGVADVRWLCDAREALREWIATRASSDLSRLHRASRDAPVVAEFSTTGVRFVPTGKGVRAAVGVVRSIVCAVSETAELSRLKGCKKDECLWAFVDRSKNVGRHWCDMNRCGAVMKARAYRSRRAASETLGSSR